MGGGKPLLSRPVKRADGNAHLFAEALVLARQCDYLPYALEALTGFASLYAKQGETERTLDLALVV